MTMMMMMITMKWKETSNRSQFPTATIKKMETKRMVKLVVKMRLMQMATVTMMLVMNHGLKEIGAGYCLIKIILLLMLPPNTKQQTPYVLVVVAHIQ